jgi:uncharacterized protein YkwD
MTVENMKFRYLLFCILFCITACGSENSPSETSSGTTETVSDNQNEPSNDAPVIDDNQADNQNPADPQPPADPVSTSGNVLADAINQYRIDQGLTAIPVSVSLTMVAEAHVGDLENNLPTGQCNLHSWSDQGSWTACCYTDDHAEAQCMYDKPREITGNLYDSNGYEIAAWNYSTMTVEQAISQWEASPGHLDVILNRNGWSGVTWNAMGAAMLGNSAVVWFGTIPDPAGSP